jgi:hypothetical protein
VLVGIAQGLQHRLVCTTIEGVPGRPLPLGHGEYLFVSTVGGDPSLNSWQGTDLLSSQPRGESIF